MNNNSCGSLILERDASYEDILEIIDKSNINKTEKEKIVSIIDKIVNESESKSKSVGGKKTKNRNMKKKSTKKRKSIKKRRSTK
jgi:hypothetical protein